MPAGTDVAEEIPPPLDEVTRKAALVLQNALANSPKSTMKTERKISSPATTQKKIPSRLAAKPSLTARRSTAGVANTTSPKAANALKISKDQGVSKRKSGITAAASPDKKASKRASQANAMKKAKATKEAKPSRDKRVRDDFKMPERDYALINALKQRALQFSRPTKKNELLRAGLQALYAMDNDRLQLQLCSLGDLGAKAPPKTI